MNPSAVVPFCFESHEVRALTISGEPWFVAKDVCDVLDLGTEQIRRLDDDEKGLRKVQTPGGDQEMAVISESGLYTLIIRSNKPQAKPFRKWVTAEVLPSIRKTGSYTLPGSGKRSRADIHHHRGPVSPGGLDIRYTLDLTKIILKPTRPTLDLLQRLTGVDVSDLADAISGPRPVDSKEEIMALIDRFAAERLRVAPGQSSLFRALYAHFLEWFAGQEPFATGYIPSTRAFSTWCDLHGYERRKPSGIATVYGLTLLVTEVAA